MLDFSLKRCRLKRLSIIFLTGMALFIAAYFVPFRLAVVSGPSMTPTLHSGQLLVVDQRYGKSGHAIARGDIVSFNFHGAKYVKRIYGLPGDVIYQLNTDNEPAMLIDSKLLEHIRKSVLARRSDARIVKVVVPPGQVYLLGDGGMLSVDSRSFGPQPQSAIIGKVTPLKDVMKKFRPLISVSLFQ